MNAQTTTLVTERNHAYARTLTADFEKVFPLADKLEAFGIENPEANERAWDIIMKLFQLRRTRAGDLLHSEITNAESFLSS